MRHRRVPIWFAVLALAGCAAVPPAGTRPPDPLAFFDGTARSRGRVTTALVSREDFTADFAGRRAGNELWLDERFHFAAGDRLQRWHLVSRGGGRFDGTVETEGASGALHAPVPVTGRTEGPSVQLDYDGYAPGGDSLLHFWHRMTGRPDGRVENRVRVSKFGLPLAGADVVFERVPKATKIR